MTAATDSLAPPSPPAVAAKPVARARFTRGDHLFFVFLAGYAGFALVVLAMGVLSAVAAAAPGLHEALHDRGVLDTLVGRGAEAMAKASHHAQPAAQLLLDYAFSLFNLALAGFLLWLRPRDRTARLLGLGMIGTAAIFNLQAYGVYEQLEGTLFDIIVHDAFHLVATVSYVLALLLFPDGRIVPRWSRGRLVAFYLAAAAAVSGLAFGLVGASRTLAVVIVFGLLAPAVGVASQAYRYRRSRSAVERQQGRLLFWALTPAFLLGVYVLSQGVTASALQTFQGRALAVIPVELFRVFQPVFAIIPIALFVGLLRFRLWNIERVISRALVYGLLAGFVGAVYIGLVVGVGRAVGARGDNVLLSVVATGVVAVAFQPARDRAQRLANRLVYGRRATPYEVLSAFADRVAEAVPTEETLARMARVLAEGTGARRVDVWLAVGGELRPAASWPAGARAVAPIPLPDGDDLPPLGDVTAACPVRHQGELLGALSVTKPRAEGMAPTEEKLLTDLAAQAGLVLRNARLTTELLERLAELRASRQRLVSAQDEVRRRLERNIHDGAQQQLVALKVKIRLAERLADKGRPVGELLSALAAETDEAIDTLRDLARGIYPPLLAAEGLPAALRAQAGKAPLPVEVSAEGVGRYDQALEAAVYFCCLEALQNVAKYAEASHAQITLVDDGTTLRFTVADDGRGFDSAGTAPGLGLQNMADRVDALGGRLDIESSPNRGTIVTGSLPLADRPQESGPLAIPMADEGQGGI